MFNLPLNEKIKQNKLFLGVAVGLWFFLFWATVSKTYAYMLRNNIEVGFYYLLLEALLIWGVIALLIPLFVWLAKKIPLTDDQKYKNVGFHILISIILVPLLALIYESLMYLSINHVAVFQHSVISTWNWGTLESYIGTVIWLGILSPLSYWLVVGGYHLKRNYKQFKEHQLRNTKLEAELSSIRLQVLKSQLHPHFLFNTLHNIHSLIKDDSAKAKKMLHFLKQFLSASVQRVGNQQVTLRDEVAFTALYMNIEKVRFSNSLHVKREIKLNTLDAKVPSFMLQPLVENAVKHGISNKIGACTLKISSRKIDSRLQLIVEDDGPGLNGNTNTSGMGLQNIQHRLNELYDEARFELATSSLGGLKVKIGIPFENNEQN